MECNWSGSSPRKVEIVIVTVLYRMRSLRTIKAATCGNLSGSRWFKCPRGASTNKILVWQYHQLVKELLLPQDHIADPTCPCETGGEMCVRKHLFTIDPLSMPRPHISWRVLASSSRSIVDREGIPYVDRPALRPRYSTRFPLRSPGLTRFNMKDLCIVGLPEHVCRTRPEKEAQTMHHKTLLFTIDT
jgi:hypothetical protein